MLQLISRFSVVLLLTMLSFVTTAATVSQTQHFLVISDIHLDMHNKNSMPIAPAKADFHSDLDVTTYKQLLARTHQEILNGTIPEPKFILLLGDIVGHHRSTASDVYNAQATVFSSLEQEFPDIPKFYVFGNNDSFVKNYGPFEASNGSSPLTVATAQGWKNGFLSSGEQCKSAKSSPCLLEENTSQGYYSAKIGDKLRLITLNSVAFSNNSSGVASAEITKQLTWLSTQLSDAKKNQEAVLIAMHIPVGDDPFNKTTLWHASETTTFMGLMDTYHEIIKGVLVGHTHLEEVRLLENSKHQVIGSQIFTAALSTSHGNASSVKSFTLEQDGKQNWHLTNYDAYAFAGDINSLQFGKLYDYVRYYCGSVTVADINDALRYFDKQKMRRFYKAQDAWN